MLSSERGSALVVALLMLVVLTLLGITATTTSNIEVQISGNDKLYKINFYAADAATEMGCELLEQNIEERNWNNHATRGNVAIFRTGPQEDSAYAHGNFYLNRDTDTDIELTPSNDNHDVVLPLAAVDTSSTPFSLNPSVPHTNIKFVGDNRLSTGSAIQLAAGYEGKGKGAAGGGAWIMYDICAQHRNVRNSEAMINLGWRHVM
jgi:hypothetical protein